MYFYSGMAQAQKGNYAKASELFKITLEISPGNEAARQNYYKCIAILKKQGQ
jgi:lipoprotein NlpI